MVEDLASSMMVFLPYHDVVWAPAINRKRMYDVDSLSDWTWPQGGLMHSSDHHRSLHSRSMRVLLALQYQHTSNTANPRGVPEQQERGYQGFLGCLNGDSGPPLAG